MVERALSLGSAAPAYERFRPGYPDELADQVLTYAGSARIGWSRSARCPALVTTPTQALSADRPWARMPLFHRGFVTK